MKKVLSTVAALGLVAGLATTASALEFSVSGVYEVEGYYISKAAGGAAPFGGSSDNALIGSPDSGLREMGGDSYIVHSFKMNPVMKVNDAITMFADIRLADDDVWGNQQDVLAHHTNTTSGRVVDASKIYMEYMSPIGKWRIGRVPNGAWYSAFVDSGARGDRIMFWPSFVPQPWGLLAFTEKITEADLASGNTDLDNDYYEVDLTYKTSTVNAALAYGYMDNQGTATNDIERHRFKGYGHFTFGNYFLETEFDILRGSLVDSDIAGVADVDYDAHAFYINGGGTFGNLTAGMMYFTITGDDASSAGDNERYSGNSGIQGTGNDFEPVLIMTGKHTGVFNNDQYRGGTTDDWEIAGVHAIGLYASYQYSPKLNLTAVLAAGWADETNTWDNRVIDDNTTGAGSLEDRDNDYGWEFDLTASYKLLDNLTYSVSFAYLDTGDFFDADPTINPGGLGLYVETDADDIYLVKHSLTMKF